MNADRESEADTSVQSLPDSDRSLTFAGRIWTHAGPCQITGDISRLSMTAVYYTTDDDGIRLIELVPDESSPIKEGVFSRILSVQVNRNGKWVSHGPRAEWELDGSRGEMQYVQGKAEGVQRHWYPNGQLHIEREWLDDEMHGRDRGWYPSGKPQYDCQHVYGKEVSGDAWDEDGKVLQKS